MGVGCDITAKSSRRGQANGGWVGARLDRVGGGGMQHRCGGGTDTKVVGIWNQRGGCNSCGVGVNLDDQVAGLTDPEYCQSWWRFG
eukprot:767273-Hanusia_phi.AAC.6